MPAQFASQKPRIDLFPFHISLNPAKNYVFNLLFRAIEEAAPERSLDAGAGQLRNRWMFPNAYFGITHNHVAYFEGLSRNLKAPIQRTGSMSVYLMRLESDFSFIGPMDMAVCTFTMRYLEDKADLMTRLAGAVRIGGSLFLEDDLSSLDTALKTLSPYFDSLDVIYYGAEMLHAEVDAADVLGLTEIEMRMPNKPDGHSGYCIHARGKRTSHAQPGVTPEIVNDRGLLIVKKDLPRMKFPYNP